ncbi:hypothetical protein XENOCAPTIV_005562 [Xenoophorus captivus]|uniref:Amine oxidase domain-containing protein n=1 Tax=Xenoophorus captivus TaxID=1517983 RepID=A0ABV0SDH5_9TELE
MVTSLKRQEGDTVDGAFNPVYRLQKRPVFCRAPLFPLTPFVIVAADYSGDGSSARRARKRSSGESSGDGQALRSSGRQSTARVKRSNNPPPGQDGYETFASWKKVWTSNGKSEPSLKAFMADQQLPFWCTKPDCRKWRQLTKEIQLTASLAATYRCGLKVNNIKRVAEVSDSWWHSMLILPPLLKESPAGVFLSAYYPDCVGMSPSRSPCDVSMAELRTDLCRAVQPQSLCPYFQPFYQPNECGKALCVRPDMMELDELYEFPEFSRDPTMYLALRNLILASWHKNCQVVVLEARDRIGGRVWDDTSLGVTVGRGAQIVNGCVNNPIALMCEQMGIRMHKLGERCDLFQEGGWVTDPAIDKRMDFHFNAILDVVSDWRNDKSQKQDTPLGGAVHFP